MEVAAEGVRKRRKREVAGEMENGLKGGGDMTGEAGVRWDRGGCGEAGEAGVRAIAAEAGAGCDGSGRGKGGVREG